MQIQTKKPAQLSSSELSIWRDIVVQDENLSSPYFHPQFILDVASVRDDVEVGVILDAQQTVGFFPFQRGGRSGQAARPVGGMLSDAHGAIFRPGVEWDWGQLLAGCRLAAWDYHYQIESQIPNSNWRSDVEPAAVMNLAGGFEAYKSRLASKSVISQTGRKARKLERECGEIRFEWNVRDGDAFELLRRWKTQQYQESDIADVFSFDWTVRLLETIWQKSSPDYEGLLSVMYVGNRPAAIHFGLRAGKVLHQWFPAYDATLRQYSPGVIHLLEVARHAESRGVERIDLGRVCHYKSRVATHCVNVAAGSVDLRLVSRMLKQGYQQTFEWLRHSSLRSVARVPGRMLRRLSEQKQLQ